MKNIPSFLGFISSDSVIRTILGFMIASTLGLFLNKYNLLSRLESGEINFKLLFKLIVEFIISFYGIYLVYVILMYIQSKNIKSVNNK